MSKLFQYILSFLALIGFGAFLAKRKETGIVREKEVEKKLEEIKKDANESELSDLVKRSNDKYGPGTGTKDS